MNNASRKQRHKTSAASLCQAARTAIPMVASLGVQARLVPTDPDREREVTCLIARYERVCCEWDRLTQRALDLLGSEFQADPSLHFVVTAHSAKRPEPLGLTRTIRLPWPS